MHSFSLSKARTHHVPSLHIHAKKSGDIIENENRVYEKKFQMKEYVVPRSLKAQIPLKPTQMNPKEFMEKVRMDDEETRKKGGATKKEEVASLPKKSEPTEVDFQYTSVSKQYGKNWSKGLDMRNALAKWDAHLGTCEETRYASSFHTMTGKSPFAKK